MGKKSVRTALFLLPAAFCLLILFFRPHSLNQVRPVTGGDKADGVFCALETEAGKREGEDRRFLPAAQPVSFSVKAGYKNGLYIKEEEPWTVCSLLRAETALFSLQSPFRTALPA